IFSGGRARVIRATRSSIWNLMFWNSLFIVAQVANLRSRLVSEARPSGRAPVHSKSRLPESPLLTRGLLTRTSFFPVNCRPVLRVKQLAVEHHVGAQV